MRVVRMLFLLLFCVAAQSDEIIEDSTKEAFPTEIKAAETTLQCTGVTVRKKYGFDIYALAHYAEADAIAAAPKALPERPAYWQQAPAAKAFVIHFVFFVDEGNLRHACEESLTAAGYTGEKQEAFLDVFARDYAAGSKLRLVADAKGKLKAELNEVLLGSWEEPELVQALWQSWLGENSELDDRTALVSRAAVSAP